MKYQHGGDIYSDKIDIDFSANINPLGMPKGVITALEKTLKNCECYPDSESRLLRARLSGVHNVPSENIICGNGAADLIFQLVLAKKPKKALLTAPSFSEYEQALKSIECNTEYHILKEESEFKVNIDEIMAQLDSTFDIIFICSPNNPTGISIRRQEALRLAEHCDKKGILFVLDECFCDFLDEPDEVSIIENSMSYNNLFILKAFTKLYAMAGIRLGYGISSDRELIEKMYEIRQPWSVSALAQAAGEAALTETEYVKKTKELITAERKYLKNELNKLGFKVYPSEANYIFFRDNETSCKTDLKEECRKRGILIRSCSNYEGLEAGYYRICIRKHCDNVKLINMLADIEEKRK